MSCPYYSWKGGALFGDYWCDKKNNEVNDDIYSKYCKGYYYDECIIYKSNQDSGGCFLTTIVCEILGRGDKDPVLETMRKFRNEVLQKDEKYLSILCDYDNMGPLLAYKLDNDPLREQIAGKLYQNSLVKIANSIENKNYVEAIKLYQGMTLFFINFYGFSNLYEEHRKIVIDLNNLNKKELGHGIPWQLKKEK